MKEYKLRNRLFLCKFMGTKARVRDFERRLLSACPSLWERPYQTAFSSARMRSVICAVVKKG